MPKLTDVHIRNWIKAGQAVAKSFGNGLTFTLSAKGTASWVLRFRHDGRQRELTLGRYPELTLKKAAEEAFKRRIEISGGIDVAREKQLRKREAKLANTITELGELYLGSLTERGRSTGGPQWHLNSYIKPKLGRLKLNDVTADDVLAMCLEIKGKPRRNDKLTAPSSAREVLGTLRRMFDFAIDHRLTAHNPASSIKPRTIAEKKSRERALSTQELKALWVGLKTEQVSPVVRLAIQLLYLTLTRKSEVIKAKWEEIDEDRAEWDIPGERTKNRKPHRVYLSSHAMTLLKDAKILGCSSTFVFPGKLGQALGESTLNEAIKRANYFGLEPFTIHDSRRTASTYLHETGWPSDVIEKALNHTAQGIRAVYNRAEYAEQRREMLQTWSDYINNLANESPSVMT